MPLSLGKEEFPDTVTCAYHGWTYSLESGELVAVITDGPDSPICGKVRVQTYPTEERLGLVWVFVGDREPHPLSAQLPEELVEPPPMGIGGRIDDRDGDWRLFAENGFDEGHAKYLHRTSLWRLFKVMPTWNKVHIERHGRWIYRIEDERHWDADFAGLGHWTNDRWWKRKPQQTQGKFLGNTGGAKRYDPYIESHDFPGFASLALPGQLRIAYPNFIHYEFYVPIEQRRTRYVGVMVQFKTRRREGGLLREVSRCDPVVVPRELLGARPLDGRVHQRAARAAVPPRHLAAGVAAACRRGQPVRPARPRGRNN